MPRIVDARGLACPQPVVLVKKAMETEPDIVAIVDDAVARENISRLAKSQGYQVKEERKGTEFHLHLIGPAARTEECRTSAIDTATVLLVTSDALGRGDQELGHILMRSFFHALGELRPMPAKVIFMNAGVRLAVKGSPLLEDLESLSENGVEISSCGTCLQFFNLKDDLATGAVTNMYSIAEALLGANKVVTV